MSIIRCHMKRCTLISLQSSYIAANLKQKNNTIIVSRSAASIQERSVMLVDWWFRHKVLDIFFQIGKIWDQSSFIKTIFLEGKTIIRKIFVSLGVLGRKGIKCKGCHDSFFDVSVCNVIEKAIPSIISFIYSKHLIRVEFLI